METKDLSNETNLPENGAEKVEETSAINESSNEQTEVASENSEAAEVVEETKITSEEFEVVEKEELPTAEEADTSTPEEGESDVEDAMEDQEKEVPKVKPIAAQDYSILTKQEMLTHLNELIRNYDISLIKEPVEDIKVNFYKKHKAEIAEAKNKFVEEGGNPEEFSFTDASEDTFKELYNQFRVKKNEELQKLDGQKKGNLKEKYQIIEEIKELINNEESINKTFQDFRELQNRWRDAGLVPQNDLKNLWESYNHTVESFYDYIKINKELRDLDLKKNFELKVSLCEKAEGLLLEESITKAFKTLQEYHNQWRETGPVPREQKDEIWERFKAATSQINKKHQHYFEGLKEQQVKNLEQKTVLCGEVEELLSVEIEKPKDWEDCAEKIIQIQKVWRSIGFAPKKDNNKIYHRFKEGCDEFFARKREFYKKTKDVQKNNLQLKSDLCVQAEALKDSTEWKSTTEDFIKLQKRWKEIGPVPKKHSESLWKKFRTACDFFFNSKSEFFSTVDSRQEDNLKLKEEMVEKVKTFEKSDDDKESLNQLIAMQKQWGEVGHVPLKQKDEINKIFRDAINEQFDKLNVDAGKRSRLNFQNKLDSWVSTKSKGKIYSERNKVVTKIKELENEILLFENNIGFFSKSSNADSLVSDINRKIETAKERMVNLKQKLRLLDQAE